MLKNIQKNSKNDLINKLSLYKKEEKQEILKAIYFAEELHEDQKRASGEPYIIHPFAVAKILINLHLDYITIIAAICHDILEDTDLSHEELRNKFGDKVFKLVDGVTKISIFDVKYKSIQNSETIRKMLFAMVQDIRVILIKLADKLHNMRTLKYLDKEKRRRISEEVLTIYAPLAGRLGISWIRAELEDLALKCLYPNVFEQIKKFIAEKRSERNKYLEKVKKAIYRAAAEENLKITVLTRIKHFYSVYYKMKKRNKPLSEIYDLLGIRILCNTEVECYSILGIVHKIWKPISGRFKDYIAMPKANRYQSLHTTVVCIDGKLIEIQIRTYEMNQTAEYGIAAHWLYKTNKNQKAADELSIINKLKNWDKSKNGSSTFLNEIKSELLKDSIYVFTPKGNVIELPKGATPLDFAYHIHTEIGNHCIGAKSDGKILPLKNALRNTQVVEILTSPKARPHLNWLRFVKTNRARTKIRSWLNKHDENLIIEKNIVVKTQGQSSKQKGKPKKAKMNILNPSKVGIKIGKDRNVMIKMAKCCMPKAGDPIIGYISRGRGIIIHRADCSNLDSIREFEERKINVEWETISPNIVRRFKVTAVFKEDIFSEIEGSIRKNSGHLISGRLKKDDEGRLTGFFVIEIEKKEDFTDILKNIRSIPEILNVKSI
jgi:GTP diphosphokinase / guanosine-3',5'-bis(diphosphate) 3'-diphosphatase